MTLTCSLRVKGVVLALAVGSRDELGSICQWRLSSVDMSMSFESEVSIYKIHSSYMVTLSGVDLIKEIVLW